MPEKPAEVVVSYSRRDSAFALRLVEALRSAGARVWIDQGGIDGALLWGAEIVEAICACRVVILVASATTLQSPGVTKEILLASEENKPILPIHLEPLEIPASLRLPLAGIQRLEWSAGDWDANFEAVTRSLERLGVEFSRRRRKSRQPIASPGTDAEAVHASAVNVHSLATAVHVSGVWKGSWSLTGSSARFEGYLDLRRHGENLTGVLTVRFSTGEAQAMIQEQVEGILDGRRVLLEAKTWCPVEQGAVEHYLLDRFELDLSPDGNRMLGLCTSTRPGGKAEFARLPRGTVASAGTPDGEGERCS